MVRAFHNEMSTLEEEAVNMQKQFAEDILVKTQLVTKIGLMSVVGQPKQNSEYIQATSRVGRQHPGIIFTVYNPYRPRDLSNYENFVGFHSQMYRYVEGTTATPFAARARDRVLHALVVSLLRLQVETMADNGGASNINDISDEQIKDIKDKILERVKITAPSSYVDTEKEMDEFINTWKNIAKDEKLYYFVPAVADDKKRLLTYYGEYYGDKEKPTLNSMRDVEQGYIASRYIDEEYNTDILNDFIFIPQLIAARKIIYQNGKAVERGTQEIIEYIQRNPSDMKLGRDKRYFYDFYAFLCNLSLIHI